jgi:uncharacterized protein YihD (DUF1040 family)
MRDPHRIKTILQVLGEYWSDTPDIRLGQLLLGAVKPASPCPELFYIEDEELLAKFQAHFDWTAEMPIVSHMNNDIRIFLDIGIATFRVGYSGISIELSRLTEEIHLVKIKGVKREIFDLMKEYISDFEQFLTENCTVEVSKRTSPFEPETYTVSYRSESSKATAGLAGYICIIADQSGLKLRKKNASDKD